MSGLAKAFVVINLILALFFLGASATLFQVQKGWKGTAEKMDSKFEVLAQKTEESLQQKDGEISTYRANNQTLGNENEVLKSQNQDLTNANEDLKKDVAQKDQTINTLNGTLATKEQRLQDKDSVIAQKEEAIQSLTSELADSKESEKDAVAMASRAVIDRQLLEEQLGKMSELAAQNENELNDAKLALASAKQQGYTGIGVSIAPKIDAVVVAVRDGIVVLSVGRDDNVKAGYEFTVYEGSRFIGKVKVENVLGDMSGARVLFTDQGETIRAGNQASTRLAG